jgi:hypothetical protein
MLRTYFLQQWLNLSDPGVEEALDESAALRHFVGVDLGVAPAPDETTICRFRHLRVCTALRDLLYLHLLQLARDEEPHSRRDRHHLVEEGCINQSKVHGAGWEADCRLSQCGGRRAALRTSRRPWECRGRLPQSCVRKRRRTGWFELHLYDPAADENVTFPLSRSMRMSRLSMTAGCDPNRCAGGDGSSRILCN